MGEVLPWARLHGRGALVIRNLPSSRNRTMTPGSSPKDTDTREGIGAETSVDPICGMAVRIAGAKHTAERDGRPLYFCSPRCLQRFQAERGQQPALSVEACCHSAKRAPPTPSERSKIV